MPCGGPAAVPVSAVARFFRSSCAAFPKSPSATAGAAQRVREDPSPGYPNGALGSEGDSGLGRRGRVAHLEEDGVLVELERAVRHPGWPGRVHARGVDLARALVADRALEDPDLFEEVVLESDVVGRACRAARETVCGRRSPCPLRGSSAPCRACPRRPPRRSSRGRRTRAASSRRRLLYGAREHLDRVAHGNRAGLDRRPVDPAQILVA